MIPQFCHVEVQTFCQTGPRGETQNISLPSSWGKKKEPTEIFLYRNSFACEKIIGLAEEVFVGRKITKINLAFNDMSRKRKRKVEWGNSRFNSFRGPRELSRRMQLLIHFRDLHVQKSKFKSSFLSSSMRIECFSTITKPKHFALWVFFAFFFFSAVQLIFRYRTISIAFAAFFFFFFLFSPSLALQQSAILMQMTTNLFLHNRLRVYWRDERRNWMERAGWCDVLLNLLIPGSETDKTAIGKK